MGKALEIRDDVPAETLRRAARRERDGRAAARMYAIAHALEGLSRAEAARLAGMERQALRDAVLRYNAEGLAGLHDRPKGRPPRRLTDQEEAELVATILQGRTPGGTAAAPGRGPTFAAGSRRASARPTNPSSMTRVLRRLAMSRQKARPCHPQHDREAQEAFKKGGSQPA